MGWQSCHVRARAMQDFGCAVATVAGAVAFIGAVVATDIYSFCKNGTKFKGVPGPPLIKTLLHTFFLMRIPQLACCWFGVRKNCGSVYCVGNRHATAMTLHMHSMMEFTILHLLVS